MTAREQLFVRAGERLLGPAQPRGPAVRDRRQLRIKGVAQSGDEVGQRICEVTIATLTEAMPRHVDRRTKDTRIEQLDERAALGGAQEGSADCEAALVELSAQLDP